MTLAIVQPTDGQVITNGILHIEVWVTGGTVVKQTSSHVVPTLGHVHVYLNDQLARMNYTLVQDFPVKEGVYSLRAEFMGSDHFPFNPRVYSKAIVIQVQ